MPSWDIARTMFGLFNLSQYLTILILAYFGLASAVKVQEGKKKNFDNLFPLMKRVLRKVGENTGTF